MSKNEFKNYHYLNKELGKVIRVRRFTKPKTGKSSKADYSFHHLVDHGKTMIDGQYEFELSSSRISGKALGSEKFEFLGRTDDSIANKER